MLKKIKVIILAIFIISTIALYIMAVNDININLHYSTYFFALYLISLLSTIIIIIHSILMNTKKCDASTNQKKVIEFLTFFSMIFVTNILLQGFFKRVVNWELVISNSIGISIGIVYFNQNK